MAIMRSITAVTLVAFGFAVIVPVSYADQQYRTKIYYYHPDHLGSTNLVTDETGQVVQRIEYTPHGQPHLIEGQDVSPHKFTGKRLDDTTGLYYFGARYYDPQLGRFIQPDTLVQAPSDPQTLNRYTYARNNPLIYTDPTGRSFWKKVKKWAKKQGENWVEQHKPRPSDPWWWLQQFRPATPVHPDSTQSFNQAVNRATTFLVEKAGFSPAAANATTAAVLAIPTGGSSLIAAGVAYATTELLETEKAQRAIGTIAALMVDFGMNPGAARAVAGQMVGTAISVGVSVVSNFARQFYTKVVGYEPTLARGGAAVEKSRLDPPVRGANNVGTQGGPPNPQGWFDNLHAEGGHVSRAANQIPGVNAVAGLHDVFQVRLDQWGGAVARQTLNFPGMPPAAAVTYVTLLSDNGTSVGIYVSSSDFQSE